jgi:cob(I)alamin adenosyltransferase
MEAVKESTEKIPEVKVSKEDEKIREELQSIFFDLLTSAQKLSYELATLDMKEEYTRDELKDLLNASKDVVANVKKMHKFLEKHTRRR